MGEAVHNLFDQDVQDLHALRTLLRTKRLDYSLVPGAELSTWTTASEIQHHIGLTPRRVRELAQIFPTALVSSGGGYKLTHLATKRERMVCVQSLLSRAEKLTHRASALTGMLT